MKVLDDTHRKIVEEYQWLVPLVFNRLKQRDDVLPYKEELLSEGYFGLCVASTTVSITEPQNTFSYLYTAILHRMIDFIHDFIFEQKTISLDCPSEDDLRLLSILPVETDGMNSELIVSDIIQEYINKVSKNSDISKQAKTRLLKENKLTQVRHILQLLMEGYTATEVAISLGVTKQNISLILKQIKQVLQDNCYKKG